MEKREGKSKSLSLQTKTGARQIQRGNGASSSEIAKSFNDNQASNEAHHNWTTLMLLTRSLPPQFLLPAWSVRQLAQASQRAPALFSTYSRHPQTSGRPRRGPVKSQEAVITDDFLTDQPDLKPEPPKPGEPEKEYLFHRTIPIDSSPTPEQTGPKQQEAHTTEPLSLFDELFPEESQARSKRQRAAEKRLDKLPAFEWNSTSVTDREERQRTKRREMYTAIPQQNEPQREEKSRYTPIRLEHTELQHFRNDLERKPLAATLPSLLILNACSTNLEESDFFRLGPRGEHIEGWTSGIIKGMMLWCWQFEFKAYMWQSSQRVIETLSRNWVIILSSAPTMLRHEHTKTEQTNCTS